MTLYLATDHRGRGLRDTLMERLRETYEVVAIGPRADDDDYPDIAADLALTLGSDRGVALCGSGVGIDIALNRHRGVRAALASSLEQVRAARHDDDANVLVLAADFADAEKALALIDVFLSTPFSGETRHSRRIKKLDRLP